MRRVVGDHTFEATGLKLAAMADAGGKSDWRHQIIAAKDSVLDVIRVACYVHQISEALEMVEHDIDGFARVLRRTPFGTPAVQVPLEAHHGAVDVLKLGGHPLG